LTSTWQYDGRGRVIQSVDTNNGQVNTAYDAMGRAASRTNPFTAVNRQYAQSIGRFNRPDPYGGSYEFGNPQSLNRYAYVSDDPINQLDSDGLGCQWVFVTIWDVEVNGVIRGYRLALVCSSGLSGPGTRRVDSPDPVQQTAPLPDDLRARLSKLLQQGGCGDFVKNLIDEVAKETGTTFASDSVLDLFDKISGPGGGGYVLSSGSLKLGGRPAAGTVNGSIGNIGIPGAPPPTVIIEPHTYYNPNYLGINQNSCVPTALHETIHLAASQGIYTDLQLADAAFNSLNAAGALSQKEIDAHNNIDRSDQFSASGWWSGILRKRCD
jgi:RHS repeat-associated protein